MAPKSLEQVWTGSPTVRIRAIGFYTPLTLRGSFHHTYLQRRRLSNPREMGTDITNTVRNTMVTGPENMVVLRSSSQGAPPGLISLGHHSTTKNEMIRHPMNHAKQGWRLGGVRVISSLDASVSSKYRYSHIEGPSTAFGILFNRCTIRLTTSVDHPAPVKVHGWLPSQTGSVCGPPG